MLLSAGQLVVKFSLRLLVLIILLVCVALALFRFAPQSYVALVNKVTPYNIGYTSLSSELLPATLKFTDVNVEQKRPDKPVKKIGSASNLFLSVDWVGFLSDEYNFWYGELAGGVVDIQSLMSEPETQSTPEQKSEASPVNIHRILSLLNLKVSDTQFLLSDDATLSITHLNTNVGSTAKKRAVEVEQDIELALKYGELKKSISVSGNLMSRYQDGRSKLALNLGLVDLSEFLNTTARDTTSQAPSNTQSDKQPVEEIRSIDWSWLDIIEPTSLDMNIEKLALGDNQLEALRLSLLIDESIVVDSLQAKVQWRLDDDLWLKDTVILDGQFSTKDDGTLNAELSAKASDSQWQVEGVVNPVNLVSSRISLKFDAGDVPLFDRSGTVSKLVTDNSQWLPTSLSMALEPVESGDGIEISQLQVKAGESDFNGTLRLVNFDNDQPMSIQASLSSEQLIYRTGKAEPNTPNKSEASSKKSKVFSTAPIDWSWMNTVRLDAEIDSKTLRVDQRALTNVKLPIIINNEGLSIEGMSAELGDGAIRSSFKVSAPKNDSVDMLVNMIASGIVLNDLKLVDEETLKGGDSRLNLDLKSQGKSAHDLASNLDGTALFHIKHATIGNDAFELIGSDLIAELIGKLNPFLKSDPTTDLKCAVVNLDISQGQVDVDKSIAMETAKMVVVADGKIDLNKETIKLEIKPRSTGGVGLDAGSLVKFLELRGTLSNPRPAAGADGLLKSGVAVGAALSTGGASLVLDGLVTKLTSGKACERALSRVETR